MTTYLKLLVVTLLAFGIAGTGALVADASSPPTAPVLKEKAPATAPAADVHRDLKPALEPTASAGDAGPVAPSTAAVPLPDEDLQGFATVLIEHAKRSEWLPVFGLGLMLASWGARGVLAGWLDFGWAKTRTGGRAIAFGAAALLTGGTSIASGQGLSVGLVGVALAAGWTASGLWEDKKDLHGSPPTQARA